MSDSLDAQILQHHTQCATRDAICRLLHVGPNRVSRVLDFFRDNHHLPPSPQNGRPKKVTDEILDYTDARTLASARLSLSELLSEIHSRFEITISRAAISMIRHDLHFHYQPARHVRLLNPGRVEDRIRFCQEMLQRPHEFLLIHFFDESHFVLGADKQWVWYRRGEENPSSTISTHKFPLSLMIFAVIGIDYKSKLLFSSGTVDAGRYIENLANLGFIDDLDQKHGVLNWIFQQNGAPSHTAQETIDWVEENCNLFARSPANLPDLNPVEFLWAILKMIVANLRPETLDELK